MVEQGRPEGEISCSQEFGGIDTGTKRCVVSYTGEGVVDGEFSLG
jgi:hypothetical protein